jgi:nucleoside-diphosphate-sugar epimerase
MRGVMDHAHAAGMLGQAGVPESSYTRLHVDGTIAVARAAMRANVERVVYVSSPGLLGPIDHAPADEDAPAHPTNMYERSKAAAERAVASLDPALRARVVTVRPEFVYGPGDTHVARLVRMIARGRFFYIGDGSALCHPTYVDDAVRGLLAAADRGRGDRVYHVAGPRPVTIRALVEAFARALGAPPPRLRVPEGPMRLAVRVSERLAKVARITPPITTSGVDFFTMNRQFSWKRAEAELAWSPAIDIDEGAARAVSWYREKGLLR